MNGTKKQSNPTHVPHKEKLFACEIGLEK